MGEDREIQVELPADLDAGVYANFAIVAGGEHDLTIDFCQLNAPRADDEGPRALVVSRVRIAPSFVGPLLQAISQNAFNREQRLKLAGGDADAPPESTAEEDET